MKDIAVIGIGLTLPYADSLEQFWEILKEGVDCVREMPVHRKLDMEKYYLASEQDISDYEIPLGAYLGNVDYFDYQFFGMTYEEAVMLEPAQRLLFQTVWKTIENAGYTKDKISNSNTAVYLGCSNSEEYGNYAKFSEHYDRYEAVNAEAISDYFNWKGISTKINTVCSSSLVAVHQASQALENNEADMAIAGGVRLGLLPLTHTNIGVESSDGRTRSFDESSEGCGGGEGVITILLKELKKAERDKDIIHAVIKGSACNQDGATVSISAPNREAQSQVIRKAWENAGVDPATITYIEAHGTATELGDVVEVEGITKAFEGENVPRQFCGISSVKSNYGHMESAAGILGLVKAVLSLQHKMIPATLHFSYPNKHITFPLTPVYVNIQNTKWEPENSIYRCGVSSFGFTGTNSHIILERASEYPSRENIESQPSSYLLTVSAKTESALKRSVWNYINFDYENKSLNDICYTANACREHYNYRIAVIFSDKEDLIHKLSCFLDQQNLPDDNLYFGQVSDDGNKKESVWQDTALEQPFIWEQIAQSYIEGKSIQWDKIYEGMDVKKVSLLPYPFEKTKCWVDFGENQSLEKEKEYCCLGWKEAFVEEHANEKKKNILFFSNGSSTGSKVAQYLRDKDICFTEVNMSSSYEKQNEFSYQCGQYIEDFTKLFKDIKLDDSLVVIFDVDYWKKEKALSDSAMEVTDGLLYMYNFCKVLGQVFKGDCRLNLIASHVYCVNEEDVSDNYGNAAFMGLGKAIQGEYHNISCRFIDIGHDVSFVWDEINSSNSDYLVAYRNGKRYTQVLERAVTEKLDPYVFQSEGVYIIAGGLGNIGIEIANAIAYWGAKHIAIITRRTFLERNKWEYALLHSEQYDSNELENIRRLLEIENLGCDIHVYSKDITDLKSVTDIIQDCTSRYHKVNGLFQCTGYGVGQSGMAISAGTAEGFEQSIASKITGTCNLLEAMSTIPFDFFTVLSSPISITGGLDSSGYIAANAFLDTLGDYGRLCSRNIQVLSLAPYKKTIKKFDTEFVQEMHLFHPMDTLALLTSIEDVLSQQGGYTIAGKVNYGSLLFKMKEMIPFQFSDSILEENERYEREKTTETQHAQEVKQIEIIGEGADTLSDRERIIVNILCSYLGYERISLAENFYEIGGDSLIALKVISHINEALGIQAVVSDLLKNPEIYCFIKEIMQKYMDSTESEHMQVMESVTQEYYPVSSSQKRLFLLNQKEYDISGWNISYVMELTEGKLDKEKLTEAFRNLLKRHEALRTSFHLWKGEVVQKIHEDIDFSVKYVENIIDINQYIAELSQPFDLSKAPLMRVMVVKTVDEKTYFLFSMHHIISDEVTMGIIMSEIKELYQGRTLSREYAQYREYSLMQQKEYQSGAYQNDEDYWLQVFAKEMSNQNLVALYDGKEKNPSGGGRIHFQLEEDTSNHIREYSKMLNMTSYWYLMTVFQILMSRDLGSQDVVTAVTTTGRHYARFDQTVGMFVNVLPLRTFVDKQLTFQELLFVVKENIIAAYQHQKYPYDKLLEKIQEKYGYRLEANVSFQMHKILFEDMEFSDDIKLKPYDFPYKASNQDILLEFYEKDNSMIFDLTYSTAKFTKKTMETFIEDFKGLIQKVVEEPSVKIQNLTVADAEKVNEMLLDFLEPF